MPQSLLRTVTINGEPITPKAPGRKSDAEIGREHLLFRVDPQVSYVSPAFAGDDAEFWNPRRQ